MTRDWHLQLQRFPCYICGKSSISVCDFVISHKPFRICGHNMCKEHSQIIDRQDMSDTDYCPEHR